MAKVSGIIYMKVVLELTEEEAEYLRDVTSAALSNESATTRILRNGIWKELTNILNRDEEGL